MSLSNSSLSAQELLNALMELRRLGPAGVFSDSGRFRAFMLDLRPGMKKEVRVLSALIDAGYLQRLQDAAEGEREIVSAQMKLWLAEEMMLSADYAFYFSDVLLAFYNGESLVSAVVSSAQPGSGSAHTGQSQLSPQNSKPPVFSGCTADECIVKGARLYAKGQYREAADWYRKAAEQGDADAQYMLGNMYRDGVGVESDSDLAVDWYCRAAAQGHAEAKQALTLHSAPKSVPMPGAKPVPQSSPKPSAPQYAPKPSAPSLRAVYADKRVGDRFEFGRYPQGADGEVKSVTWRVLQREKDYLLVIAELGLDCKPYNEDYCNITWADCSLRRWLNADFYNRAFSEQERALILPTRIANNAGPATEDRVFLLSVEEAERLFADDNDRMLVPTVYAIKNGVYTNDEYMIDGIGCCWWWLRSRGWSVNSAAVVSIGRGVYDYGDSVHNVRDAVRPAFKIAL